MIRSQAPLLMLRPAGGEPGASGTRNRQPSDGERAAFVAALVERYRAPLMRHLRGLLPGMEAEDVFQETCKRLLEVPQLDRTVARARAYMFKIATHLAYDRYRRRPAESLEGGGHHESLSDATHQPETIVGFEEGCEIVRNTLLELKPRCRQVFLLRIAEGLPYETIAEILGIGKRTVEREMKHALDACQRRLQR